MGGEIGLRFFIRPRDRAEAERLLRDAAREGRADTCEFTYFDTLDRSLWRRGSSRRVCKLGERCVETIECETSLGLEREVREIGPESRGFDLETIRKAALGDGFGDGRLETDLRPMFKVVFQRFSFRLGDAANQVYGGIDSGHIEANGKTLGLCDLELEGRRSGSEAFFDVARRIAAEAPVRPTLIGKAERGYRLADGTWGRSVKGSKPRLVADMTCRDSFRAIAWTCLHDFMLNEAALETEDAVEAVHQARVSVRKLRAAMTLFRPMLADSAFDGLRDDMKWHADTLGRARDLDVLRAKWPKIADMIEERRVSAHRTVSDVFESVRSRSFLVDLVAWIDSGLWQKEFTDLAEARMCDFVSERLAKRRKKLVASGRDLERLDGHSRHRIRIAAKKLRYMCEFFVEVPGCVDHPKRFEKFVAALEDLQEALGALHDREVGSQMVVELTGLSADDARIEATGSKSDDAKDLARAIRAYERLGRTRPF